MNWQIGKARSRSDEHEAEIGIVDETGIYGRIRVKNKSWTACKWSADGLCATFAGAWYHLLPPRLSLEEAARECEKVVASLVPYRIEPAVMLAALQHFVKLQEEGRV